MEMGGLMASEGMAEELVSLFSSAKEVCGTVSKARSAKLIRTLLGYLSKVDEGGVLQVSVVEGLIEWAGETGRKFLRQRLEGMMTGLYAETGEYTKALELLKRLLVEVKALDDKLLLAELHLVESKVYHAVRNLPKAKAALTSSRTNATSVFCPPLMQADIENQAGIIQADDKDYKTAYSYFYEAFEGFSSLTAIPELATEAKAVAALKHMLLCKIMMGKPEDVTSLVNSKAVLKFSGSHVTAMQAIAAAAIKRSLHDFQGAIEEHADQVAEDPVVASHLKELYDTLFEANLLRIIEPYESVQVSHVASTIDLPLAKVEAKLSTMILDGKLNGVLDQDVDALILFEESSQDKALAATQNVITEMSGVVASLYKKVDVIAASN